MSRRRTKPKPTGPQTTRDFIEGGDGYPRSTPTLIATNKATSADLSTAALHPADLNAKSYGEVGVTGIRQFGGIIQEEFRPELQGVRGRAIYREMTTNDDTIGGMKFIIERMLLSATWKVEPGTGRDAAQAADLIESCMSDMSSPWQDMIAEILSFLTFGWSYFEIVPKRRLGPTDDPTTNSKFKDQLVGWRKIAPRGQETLDRWEFDKEGGMQGMWQRRPDNGEVILLPIDRCLHFSTQGASGNPEGVSLYRNAYRPWLFKKTIEEVEAIGVERDLAGIPEYQVTDPTFNLWDANNEEMVKLLAYLEQAVQRIRQDATTGLVTPYGLKFNLVGSPGSKQFNTGDIVKRHNWGILRTVLAQFLELGMTGTGALATAKSHRDTFLMSLSGWLFKIAGTFNAFAIPRLLARNPRIIIDTPPTFRTSNIRQPDIADIADPLSKLIAAAAIIPDRPLEIWLRETASAPPKEEEPALPGEAIPTETTTEPAPATLAGTATAIAKGLGLNETIGESEEEE